MYVHCDQCGYDSGDKEEMPELAEKVNSDGGKMVWKFNPGGYLDNGWTIVCPNGHSGDSIHLD